LLLAAFGELRIVLQEAAFVSRITVLGHIYRENRLAVLHVPGIFRYQMAGATLCSDRIRRTVIQGAYAHEMLTRIQGTMNMTILTIRHNDDIIFVWRELTFESFL